ncbi:MAG: hypothetical protein JO104_10375, partial [Candidatus Eremiobacteraeota bacterium]|nr:hypothetical protein [Candidatus Eremiobacteraeota bacterium]
MVRRSAIGLLVASSILAGCSAGRQTIPSAAARQQEQRERTISVLHFFAGPPDGTLPNVGRLVSDGAGNLYGATNTGGSG